MEVKFVMLKPVKELEIYPFAPSTNSSTSENKLKGNKQYSESQVYKCN